MPSHIIHPIPPVFDTDSRILILGSFPSVKSRESCFFYGHPQNRFWKLLAQPAKGRYSILRRGKEGISAAEPHRRLGHHPQLFHRRIQRQFHPRRCPKRPRLYPGSRFHPGDLHKRRAVRKNVRPLLP